MTEGKTVPAPSPTQADDAYLAAVSALLMALTHPNMRLTEEEYATLLDTTDGFDEFTSLSRRLRDIGVAPY